MAQKLGNVPVGTILHMKENGVYQDYLVVHQGLPSSMYDASCNGTWLLRNIIYNVLDWGDLADYRNSPIQTYLNSTFLGLFDGEMQDAIRQVRIPYWEGYGYAGHINVGSNGLSCKIFLLRTWVFRYNHKHGEPTRGWRKAGILRFRTKFRTTGGKIQRKSV